MNLSFSVGYFFGSMHPLLVHLPIGFILAGLIIEVIKRMDPSLPLQRTARILWTLSFFSGIAAAACGLFLANSGLYIGDGLTIHKWVSLTLVLITAVPAAHYAGIIRLGGGQKWTVMAGLAALLLVSGHFGGAMTHGETPLYRQLTFQQPQTDAYQLMIRDLDLSDTILLYEDLLAPVFEDKCVVCHNPEVNRGNFDMSNHETLIDDTFGDNVRPGDPWNSKVLKRVVISPDNKKFMPPFGTPMAYHEKRLLEWWILEGALTDMNIRQMEPTQEMQSLLKTYFNIDFKEKSFYEKIKVDPLPEEIIAEIKAANFNADRLAADNYLIDVTRTGQPADISAAEMSVLLKAANHITWLDLSQTGVTDEHLRIIGQFPHLTRLKLPNTQITDEGMVHLKELDYLSSLNIYGTRISGQSIESLASLPSLRKLYVWQSGLEKEDIEALKSKRSGLEVVGGIQ